MKTLMVRINGELYHADPTPEGFSQFEAGHMIVEHGGNHAKGRYELLKLLGIGGFGQVFKAKDLLKDKTFALKVSRIPQPYIISGLKEIKTHELLTALDPEGYYVAAELYCKFFLHSHVCFGMPLLGMSLERVLRYNDSFPLPISQIRHILFQLVQTISFLHSNNIIHTDVKTGNILFAHIEYDRINVHGYKYVLMRESRVCLTDFGSVKYSGEESYTGLVTTRNYRAPEVILQQQWTRAIDIWSLGCVLFEMYSGFYIVNAEDDLEHLFHLEKVLGPFPKEMILTERRSKYFTDDALVEDFELKTGRRESLMEEIALFKRTVGHNLGDPEVRELIDLLFLMLEYDPEKRINLPDVMDHAFLKRLTPLLRLQHGLANPNLTVPANAGEPIYGITCGCMECQRYQDDHRDS